MSQEVKNFGTIRQPSSRGRLSLFQRQEGDGGDRKVAAYDRRFIEGAKRGLIDSFPVKKQ